LARTDHAFRRQSIPVNSRAVLTKVIRYDCFDFEDASLIEHLMRQGLPTYYDLVISAEVMTSIPKQDDTRVGYFIDKMCSMSKKYVVNIDWFWDKERGERKPQRPIYAINNYHEYDHHYRDNSSVHSFDRWKLEGFGEYTFIARMK
jgi:hypothetical protein